MEGTAHYSPYEGHTFLTFLSQFLIRVWQFITGQLAFSQLASDEIQIAILSSIAISSALVGSFLVLKKMTMLANSFSHTILIGIVIVFLLTKHSLIDNTDGSIAFINIHSMLIAAVLTGIATAFLTEFLTKVVQLQEDASTGLVFTSLFALGILLITLFTRNAHIGTEVVMGNVDALHADDLQLALIILVINILSFSLLFKEYKITIFDAGLANTFGISTLVFNYLLMIQVSLTIIGAFRAVGVLMVLAFITGPALMARMLTNDLKHMLIVASVIGCIASFLGVALSRHILSVYNTPLSTAGIVVCTIVALFLLTLVSKSLRRRILST